MSEIIIVIFISLAVALMVYLLTGRVRRGLIAWGVYDAPNDRSLHEGLKPRGGGLAILGVVVPVWAGWASVASSTAQSLWAVLAATLVLAVVSFIDDVRGLVPAPRFITQIAAVVGGLLVFDAGLVFQGWLPLWADRLVAGIAWLWFINSFNFMDGIDGISGVETISVGFGLGLIAVVTGQTLDTFVLPFVLAGAAVGFLVWNWAPSKIFLGDVGSIPLGYLLGWLLLLAAAKGEWAAALILPSYYLADTTWTLCKRIFRGAKPWEAHKEHAYQRAIEAGATHAFVAKSVAVADMILVACALISVVGPPGVGLAGAVAVVLVLLRRLTVW